MTEYTLERRQIVPRPLDVVFAFFADPRNLTRITPPRLHLRILNEGDLTLRRGFRLHYVVRPFWVNWQWTSEIVEWDPPRRFVDVQVRGPYREWRHVHEFRPVNGATEILDQVSYAMPYGPFGRLAQRLVVRRQLAAIFDYRAQCVRERFGL